MIVPEAEACTKTRVLWFLSFFLRFERMERYTTIKEPLLLSHRSGYTLYGTLYTSVIKHSATWFWFPLVIQNFCYSEFQNVLFFFFSPEKCDPCPQTSLIKFPWFMLSVHFILCSPLQQKLLVPTFLVLYTPYLTVQKIYRNPGWTQLCIFVKEQVEPEAFYQASPAPFLKPFLRSKARLVTTLVIFNKT